MSTSSLARKDYTLRIGSLWRTDDATPVTAVTIPTRTDHIYTLKVFATAISDAAAGGFVKVASLMNVGGVVSQLGTTASILSVGPWTLTADASGTNIRIRVTGAAATVVNWQVAVDIFEGGLNADFTGWTNG